MCNFDVSLDSQVAFNFSEGKLLNLTGNLQLNSEEKSFLVLNQYQPVSLSKIVKT